MSDKVIAQYSAGDLIVLTTGEYSNFSVRCVVRALRYFTEADLPWVEGTSFSGKTIRETRVTLEWLLSNQFVAEVESRELHLEYPINEEVQEPQRPAGFPQIIHDSDWTEVKK